MGWAGTVRRTLDRFAHAAETLHDGDPTAVHRLRVASRRLREMLPLLRLEPRRARKFKRQLRNVTRVLGETRELDVLRALVTELQSTGRYPADALRRVGMTIEHERAESRRALKATLPLSKIKRLIGRLEDATAQMRDEETIAGDERIHGARHARRWVVDACVVHRATRAGSAIETAGVLYIPERLHHARIALKRLRYATELQASVDPGVTRRRVAALSDAQDVLGQLHDFEALIERVRREQVTLTPPDVTAWRELKGLVDALDNDCRRRHGVFVQHRSMLLAIVRDLGGPSAALVPNALARHRVAAG
jgi:CHAD domain-containing protein